MNTYKEFSSHLTHGQPVSIYSLVRSGKLLATTFGLAFILATSVHAAEQSALKISPSKAKKQTTVSKQPVRTIAMSTAILPRMELSIGQSFLFRLPVGVNLQKVKVDDEKVVQVEVTTPKELVIYSKSIGSTSVMIWDKSGQVRVMDVSVVGVNVGVDTGALQAKLEQILPNEKGIRVGMAADSIVLTGTVADAVKVDKVMALAEAYAGKEKDKKVINMLQVAAPQQVMLEVKMAEVSKNLLDKLGAQFNASRSNGGVAYAIAAGFLSLTGANPLSPGGLVTATHGNTSIQVDAENKDGIVKILAEPNIIAISGQEGSFLAGGKLFIPVPQNAATGLSTITLEEKEFGVGLKFTPTVLEDGLINLKVAPEVSELSQSGTEIIAGAGRSVLPSFITRRASTTVQLRDGQSFAIAGLIKNNVTETIRRFPILGSIPILGALFRSSEFQNDKTELIFVVTPRLVKPLPPDYALPTDSFVPPDKADFFLNGKMEGAPAQPATEKVPSGKDSMPKTPVPNKTTTQSDAINKSQDGFELK